MNSGTLSESEQAASVRDKIRLMEELRPAPDPDK